MSLTHRQHWPWSRYSNFSAKRRGRQDGAKNIPPPDADKFADYEMELKNLADENIRRIGGDWAREDRTLKREYCQALSDYERARKESAPAEAANELAGREHREATDAMGEHYGQIRIPMPAYLLLMTLIAIGEVPLNAIAFRIMGESEILTYIVSLVIAIGIPFSAHALGMLLRKEPFKQGLFTTESIFTVLTIVMPVMGILAVAYVRQVYLQTEAVQEASGVEVDPMFITLVFIIINLFIYSLASLASYLTHDPVVDNWRRKLKLATHELKIKQRIYADVQRRHGESLSRLEKYKAERQNRYEEKKREAEEIIDFVHRMIDVYRGQNLLTRQNTQRPSIWEKYPRVGAEPPFHERDLDWDCHSDAPGRGPAPQARPPIPTGQPGPVGHGSG